MNPRDDEPTEGTRGAAGSGSILRAVGSLLVALSGGDTTGGDAAGGDDAGARRLLGLDAREADRETEGRARYEPRYIPQYDPGYEPDYAPRPREEAPRPRASTSRLDGPSDAEAILSEARERAQRILDDSLERARALVRGERPGRDGDRALEEVQRWVRSLVTEVRDVQQRLARIEGMLMERRAPAPAPRPRTRIPDFPPEEARPPSPYEPDEPQAPPPYAEAQPYPEAQPYTETPPYVEERPAARDVEPWRERADEPSEEATPPPDFRGTVPAPAPSPPPASLSIVDPMYEPQDEPQQEPDAPATSMPETPSAPTAPAPASAMPRAGRGPRPLPNGDAPPDDGRAPIATFLPEQGSIVLRISPVSGFQGLMRVQDALARLPSVRHAAVEAYSQGEARLRIEISEPTDSDEIADGMSRSLKGPAHVQAASEAARELSIALRPA